MHVPTKYNDAYSCKIQLNALKLLIDKVDKDGLPEVSKSKEGRGGGKLGEGGELGGGGN